MELKMIEYVEECSPECSSSCLSDPEYRRGEHVDALIEVYEVVDASATQSCRILALKQACGHIQDALLGIKLLDTDSDSLYQVSLAYTRRPENK